MFIKKFADDCWTGPDRTVIPGRLDKRVTAGIFDRPAKLKEVTKGLVRIIMKTTMSFGNVEV